MYVMCVYVCICNIYSEYIIITRMLQIEFYFVITEKVIKTKLKKKKIIKANQIKSVVVVDLF